MFGRFHIVVDTILSLLLAKKHDLILYEVLKLLQLNPLNLNLKAIG